MVSTRNVFVFSIKQDKRFLVSLILSALIHLIFLSSQFGHVHQPKRHYRSLEAVLVNQSTKDKPQFSQVQAQNNMIGGGNGKKEEMTKTFLPILKSHNEGKNLKIKRSKASEKHRAKIITSQKIKNDLDNENTPLFRQSSSIQGTDIEEEKAIIASIRGQIARLIEERNRALRRLPIGLNAQKVSHAYYTNAIATRIEEYGSQHFPAIAKNNSFKLMITLSITQNGQLEKIVIEKSSGNLELDKIALSFIQKVFPFRAFPPDIARDYSAIDMTRTIHFWSSHDLHRKRES